MGTCGQRRGPVIQATASRHNSANDATATQTPCQPNWAAMGGAPRIASAMPIGMKLPQAPIAKLRCDKVVATAIRRGAVTTQDRKATLSITRQDSSQAGPGANAPA